MEKIAKTLQDVFNVDTEIDSDWGHVYANNDELLITVTLPHSGNNYRYMLRASAKVSFDRWANSTAVEEFFETAEDLVKYVRSSFADIYKACIGALHEDYHYLLADFRTATGSRWGFNFCFKNANKYRTKKKLDAYLKKLSKAYEEADSQYASLF